MAECTQDDDVEQTPGYKAPAQKSLKDILDQDQEDESLRKYKEALLGSAANVETIGDATKPYVELKCMTFMLGDEKIGEFEDFKNPKKPNKVTIPEGAEYKVILKFLVRNQIAFGLKLRSKFYKMKVQFGKTEEEVIGSFGPNADLHKFEATRVAPTSMNLLGSLTVKSMLTDDDKSEYFSWEWHLGFEKQKKAK